jgi:hypothetical protein
VIRVGTNDCQRFFGVAVAEPDAVLDAVPPDPHLHPFRQSVDHGRAYAMQSAGNLVRVLVEFTARMQSREHDFSGRNPLLLVDVGRDAATVVTNRDAAVAIQCQFDLGGVSGLNLVHRVVDDLERHMMQAGAVISVADIHPRTSADGIQASEDGDRRSVVGIAIFGRGIGGCSGVV